jgi:hypothetical protein
MDWEGFSTDEVEEVFDHFSGLSSAALSRLCDAIRLIDERQAWMTDGARSLTDWVAARARIRRETAVRLVSISRRLVDLPVIRKHFAAGELSLDQVDAVSGVATPDTELEWVGRVLGLSAGELDRLVRRHRGIDEVEAKSVWERRRLVRQWNLDESELKFHGRLPGDQGRIFDEAIDTRVDEMPPNPETGLFDPLETRAADALTELAATANDGVAAPAQVTVFADLQALTTESQGHARLDNTAPLSNTAAQRLACDSLVETVLTEGAQTVGIGRRSRKIPAWLRRLVIERDGGCCRFPGCGNRRWLQVHHIISWADGGPTDLDNLILVCGFHHRFVHEHGWKVTGPPDGRVFRKPDWTPFPRPREPLDPRLRELVRTT